MPEAFSGREQSLARAFGGAKAINGTVVYAALIAAGALHIDEGGIGQILLFGLVSVLVSWATHVFADVLAHRSAAAGPWLPAALRAAITTNWGYVAATVVPSLPLVLSLLGLIDSESAVVLALWAAVLTLGALGFIAARVRGMRWYACLVPAALAGLFGYAFVWLYASTH